MRKRAMTGTGSFDCRDIQLYGCADCSGVKELKVNTMPRLYMTIMVV